MGARDGMETIQVYLSQESPSVKRPAKELKGFKKARLRKGEARHMSLRLDLKYSTAFWDEAKNKWICEKGKYEVLVGTSSRGHFEYTSIRLDETTWWTGL